MVRSDTRWDHRRSVWRPLRAAERAEGWELGCSAFPWVYFVRDTGIPVSETPRDRALTGRLPDSAPVYADLRMASDDRSLSRRGGADAGS
ncbi:hypothetical protein GCM10010213_25510 [Microbacterium maritypicum]|uniref:Uncharacterized protein n=2 Tax=Microbacterium maritypicum TaxID=33918 RepID=A0A4Y4B7B7_MICMQ|nr:hypothetical protein MLI01_26060 [Microbacterium liquefaciens]GGV61607.1 hypothetical protein GCM10010213_25510 [Microbacterium liquefaciens]